MSFDMHLHSIFSDGELLPSEIARRYAEKGFEAIAITDRNMEFILKHLLRAKGELQGHDIKVLIGIELTHLPPDLIPRFAVKAKKLGAEVVVVHGETIVEPVARGTNSAGVSTPDVDILSHPGLITVEEAELAKENEIFLELSARKGHCLANGHVARVAEEVKAELLVNTDSHAPEDIILPENILNVALASGLSDKYSRIITAVNPRRLTVD